MKVLLIAAVASNGVIGKDNDLPWKIRDDMKFFRQTTRGHAVITGRKNFEAMGGPLPKRDNYVVTRQAGYQAAGATVCPSVEEALRAARASGESEAFIIGGAQIYALALPYAHTYYRTRVLAEVTGDTLFPSIDEGEWELSVLERRSANAENEHAFVIERLDRRGPVAPY